MMRRFKKTYKYKIHTRREFTQQDGKVVFKLNHVDNLLSLLSEFKNDGLEKLFFNKECDLIAPINSGVYVVAITDIKNNITDVAYVGSSKNLYIRFMSHTTLHFLKHALSESYKIEIYVNSIPDMYRSFEGKVIKKLQPFLNKETLKNNYIEYTN